MTPHDDPVKRVLRLLSYHQGRIWWITSRLLALTVVITVLGLLISPRYVARTKFTLLPTRSEIGYASQRPETWGLSPATMLGQTHVEMLLSRTLAQDLAATLQSEAAAADETGGVVTALRRWVIAPITGAVQRTLTFLNTGRWHPPEPQLALAQAIQSRTRVENVPGSFVFQVAVTWEDPRIAARIANLLTERYVEKALTSSREEMTKTREFIEGRIAETRDALNDLMSRIKDYRASEQIYTVHYNTSADLDLELQELSQYMRDWNATRVSGEQLDARIGALKAYQMPADLAVIEAERTGLKSRQEALHKVIAEQMATLEKIPAKEAGLLDLYRERAIVEHDLSSLQDRLLETRVAEAAQLSAMRVIDLAIPPPYPERPLLLRNAAAAIVVGLLISAAVVMMIELRQPGVRSREDLVAEGMTLLGVVPQMAADDGEDPEAGRAGPLRGFLRRRTHGRHGTAAHRRMAQRHLEHVLLRLTEGDGAHVCAVVSLNGGEGKTQLIEHLAKLAVAAGRKVLLIDANFSAPALHHKFGKRPAPGLAEMLTDGRAAAEVITDTESGADLIGAGLKRPNAQAKWALDAVRRAIGDLAPRYDLVLIECAALRRDASAIRLLPLATHVACVVDAATSHRGDLDDIRHRLDGAKGRLEVVLNKVRHTGDYLFTPGVNGHEPAGEEASEPAADEA